MKEILLTHEWIAQTGGSENVFEQLGEAFPDADQYCLWNDDKDRFPRAEETWLARSPVRHHKAAALPLLRSAMRSIPIDEYQTVVASSHAFGHYNAYRAASIGLRGFAYVHSPARYLWAPTHDPRGQTFAARSISPVMRRLDRRTASGTVHYAANSYFVRGRIRTSWNVDAHVIHPPVAVDEISSALSKPMSETDYCIAEALPQGYILGASRLVRYKGIDRVIQLAADLRRPLVIAGSGPEKASLAALAESMGVEAVFVGRVSNRLLYEIYSRAALFVFPPVEDFGIMPLEAISAGAPVLVNREGGAWEGVEQTGAGYRFDPNNRAETAETANLAIDLKHLAGPHATEIFNNRSFQKSIIEWVGK